MIRRITIAEAVQGSCNFLLKFPAPTLKFDRPLNTLVEKKNKGKCYEKKIMKNRGTKARR